MRLAAEMAEEMSIPSLSLIEPGKILDEAACDRIRDAIAIECEALLTKLDAEKEATLTAFEKQAQEQMDQIQAEIEAEQLAIQQKKLADQEKIFKQQLKVRPRHMRLDECATGLQINMNTVWFFMPCDQEANEALQNLRVEHASQVAAAAQKAASSSAPGKDDDTAALITRAVEAQTAVLKAASDQALAQEKQRLASEYEKEQELFRVQIEQLASKTLDEEEKKIRAEFEKENDKILIDIQNQAQAQLDEEIKQLKIETEKEKETFRLLMEQEASRAFADEEAKLKSELAVEKSELAREVEQERAKAVDFQTQLEKCRKDQALAASQNASNQVEMDRKLSAIQTELDLARSELTAFKASADAMTGKLAHAESQVLVSRNELVAATAAWQTERWSLSNERDALASTVTQARVKLVITSTKNCESDHDSISH